MSTKSSQNGISNPRTSLLDTLEKRQDRVMSQILKFLTATSLVAFIGFSITSAIQWFNGTLPAQHRGLISISNPTLGALIATFLTLVSILIMWVFAFWSVTLIPYVTVQAYRASREFKIPAGTKVLRWVQLWISTFIPIAIFAVLWNSIANSEVNARLRMQSLGDFLSVAVGAAIVVVVLWFINLLPDKYVTIHIPFLSSLLYAALFLTYGGGFGLASNSMLFGVLVYLAFGLDKFEKLARRITIYDIDPKVADDLGALLTQVQEAEVERDKTKVQTLVYDTKKERLEQLASTVHVGMDAFLLERVQVQFDRALETFSILSGELSKRHDDLIKREIKKLQREAKRLPHEELSRRTSAIMARIASASKDIPEQLQVVRNQVIEAGKQYQEEVAAIEQRRKGLLEDPAQIQQRHKANILTNSINTCFDRLRNMVTNQPGINYLTKDKVLQSAETTHQALLAAVERGNHDKIESFLSSINATLNTFSRIAEVVRTSPEEKKLVEQSESEKVARVLDRQLKRCVQELGEAKS